MQNDTFTTDHIPHLVLRQQQPGDEAAVNALYHSMRTDLHALPMPPEAITELILQQQHFQAIGMAQHYPQAQTWVLTPSDAANTTILARLIYEHGASAIRLIDIMVSPMIQRRGMGRQLLRYLQDLASTHSLPLTLGVMRDNLIAQNLYRACGFVTLREDYLDLQMQWLPGQGLPAQSLTPDWQVMTPESMA